MTVAISKIVLLNVERNQVVGAELWDAITEQQIADWEAEWIPELFKSLQRLRRAGIERQHWPQSRHWNWQKKMETLQGMLAFPAFSVVCDGMTQGMMIVDTTTKRSRIESQKGKNLVHVRFIENAPWNRKELLYDPPRYRGIGSVLIGAAIKLSKEEDFKGRVGLHSLPQSNSFYANSCGMTDMGVDPDPNYAPMRYFEMSPEQAEAFIVKGQ